MRLRQLGVAVSTIYVEADEFGTATVGKTRAAPGPNRWGYFEAVPDPARIDLAGESPRGVRNWGKFRVFGFPTTILLDERNVVLERYRGALQSQAVFGDVIALARRNGTTARAPIDLPPQAPAADARSLAPSSHPASSDRFAERAGNELIGLWKVNNPEAKDPRPLFLRVIGVNATEAGQLQLEASLSFKLTKWVPMNARCEPGATSCVLHLITGSGGQLTAKRQADGTYAGNIVYGGRSRLVRPITMAPMSLDEAEL
ncbi:MAG: hypothetical protein ABI281_03050 [Caldimonas sp.]